MVEEGDVSLRYAILVLLKSRPGSGYDLAQGFRQTVGNFWTASHQQIYQELKRLSADGLLDHTTEHQPDRPDRKVYSLTAQGRSALADWMQIPVKPPRINESLLVKIYGAEPQDVPGLRAELARNTRIHQQQLETYLTLEQAYLTAVPAARKEFRMPYLTLRRGILSERSWLDWAREAEVALDELAKTGE